MVALIKVAPLKISFLIRQVHVKLCCITTYITRKSLGKMGRENETSNLNFHTASFPSPYPHVLLFLRIIIQLVPFLMTFLPFFLLPPPLLTLLFILSEWWSSSAWWLLLLWESFSFSWSPLPKIFISENSLLFHL